MNPIGDTIFVFTMNDKFLYCGLFLETSTRDKLLEYVQNNFDTITNNAERVYLDHCTLLHVSAFKNSPEKAEWLYNELQNHIGESFPITLTHIGCSNKACAFRVDGVNDICMNENPHITIATFNGGKPVESNNIEKWMPISPISINAKLIFKFIR